MSDSQSKLEGADFESAAQYLIQRLNQEIANSSLGKSSRNDPASIRVARTSVHVIAKDGWRQLAAAEWSRSATEARTQMEVRRSSILWRLMRRHECAVSITTDTGAVTLYRAGEPPRPIEVEDDDDLHATTIRDRATHALAIPLRDSSVEVSGMVALEIQRMHGAREDLDWSGVLPALLDELSVHSVALLAKPTRRPVAVAHLPARSASSRIVEAGELARVFAPLRDHLLIKGPTGTGKTYLARQIHALSGRTGSFLPYNALAFPDDLQVAYLVGWEKGAFYGADRRTLGAIEEARNGTLFIDEVDKLSARAQRLLLTITDRNATYSMLGTTKPIEVGNVRFVFATNANLEKAVSRGTFLRDLYYRINVLPISVPALEERRHEIAEWCRVLLDEVQSERRL